MKARIPNQGGNSQANMMKKIQEMQENMTRIQQERFPAIWRNVKNWVLKYCPRTSTIL